MLKIKKKILKKISENLFDKKKDKSIIFLNKIENIEKTIKDNSNGSIIIVHQKINYQIIRRLLYILIKRKIKFKKNFFIIYRFNNILIGQNLIPKKINYQRNNYFSNFFQWLKKLIYIILFNDKVDVIFIDVS